jgi:hypothetical protein
VPVPAVPRYEVDLAGDGPGAAGDFVVYGRYIEHIDLPPEVAIREIPDLDLADPSEIAGFLDRYGAVVPPWHSGAPRNALLSDYMRPYAAEPTEDHHVPISLVRFHLEVLRALVAHWEAASSDADDSQIVAAWVEGPWPSIDDERMAWHYWSDSMNAALEPFSVRISVDVDGVAAGLRAPLVTTYSALALQIANDVASESPWRRCSNETCGQLFVRQAGRAVHDQHRTSGVKYCSRECARAQAQREFRRRKAQEKENHDA